PSLPSTSSPPLSPLSSTSNSLNLQNQQHHQNDRSHDDISELERLYIEEQMESELEQDLAFEPESEFENETGTELELDLDVPNWTEEEGEEDVYSFNQNLIVKGEGLLDNVET